MRLISNFQERIKEALEIRNLKPSQLSDLSNINKSTISQYLKGIYKPKYSRIKLFAEILNVDEVWLTGYDVPYEKTSINILSNPEITNEEMAEFNKIKNINLLMFNNNLDPTAIKKLEKALYEAFISSLLKKQKKDKGEV